MQRYDLVGDYDLSMAPISDGDYVLYDDAKAEISQLRAALADIVNPIEAMRRDLGEGYRLDGAMAAAIANDPEHYKRIARAALAMLQNGGKEDAI